MLTLLFRYLFGLLLFFLNLLLLPLDIQRLLADSYKRFVAERRGGGVGSGGWGRGVVAMSGGVDCFCCYSKQL